MTATDSGSSSDAKAREIGADFSSLIYCTINAVHDFAYFGYKVVEPLLLYAALLQTQLRTDALLITLATTITYLFWQVLLEPWSGGFADVKGRMRAVAVSLWLRVAACGLLATTLWYCKSGARPYELIIGFLIVQAIMAAAESLLTGSIDAWITDSMRFARAEDRLGAAFSGSLFFQNVAILVAMPSFLFLKSALDPAFAPSVLLGTAAIVFAFCGLLAHALRHEKYRQGDEWAARSTASLRDTLGAAWVLAKANPTLRSAMLLVAAPWAAWLATSWFWPLILTVEASGSQASTNTEQAGTMATILGVVIGVGRIGGSWIALRIERMLLPLRGFAISYMINLMGSAGFIGVLILTRLQVLPEAVAPFAVGATIFLAFLSQETVKVFRSLVLQGAITDDTLRATAISYSGVLGNVAAFAAILVACIVSYCASLEESEAAIAVVGTAYVLSLVLSLGSVRRVGRREQADQTIYPLH